LPSFGTIFFEAKHHSSCSYGFNCDLEQIGTFDWTFTHEKQLHPTMSPIEMNHLQWKVISHMRQNNLSLVWFYGV